MRDGVLLSIVVPVIDEEAAIGPLLDHLAALGGRWEVLVADGGSEDGTRGVAAAHRVAPRIVDAPRGRAGQQNAAAAMATGEAVVFLHADSRLPPGAHASIVAALDHGVVGGNFRLRFDGGDRFSMILGRWYALQRRTGVFYGDSTIWARRDHFEVLGGFPELPIMEDYAFARTLTKSGRTACLPGPATTSARRWRAYGIPRTVASWVIIRWLWLAGVPAERLARLYGDAR